MTLYELSEQYQAFLDMIDEIPDDAFADTLEALEGEIDEKIDGIVSVMKNLTAEAAAIAHERDALDARIKSKEKHVARLKEYLKGYMMATGRTKIETARNVVGIANGTPRVILDDAFLDWAVESRRIDLLKPPGKPEPDKAAIKKALQDGAIVPFAQLEQGTALRIK